MKRMTLTAVLVSAVLAFALAGCSSAQSMTEDTLKGTWALDSGANLGFDAYAYFGDEGTAELMVADSDLTGEWSVSGTEGTLTLYSYDSTMFLSGDDESEMPEPEKKTAKMTYSNNKLTVGSSDGSKLVFVKDDSEETKELFGAADTEGKEIELSEPVVNSMDPVTIVDDDRFAIKVLGTGTDEYGDAGYQLSITNKTDKNVDVENAEDFTVGGKAAEYPFLSDYIEAGETVETFLTFSADDVSSADELADVSGTIVLYDDDVVTSIYEADDDDGADEDADEDADIDSEDLLEEADEPDLAPAELARITFHMD